MLFSGGSFCSIRKHIKTYTVFMGRECVYSAAEKENKIFLPLQYSQTQRADSWLAVRETFGSVYEMKLSTNTRMSLHTHTHAVRPNDCARIKKFSSTSWARCFIKSIFSSSHLLLLLVEAWCEWERGSRPVFLISSFSEIKLKTRRIFFFFRVVFFDESSFFFHSFFFFFFGEKWTTWMENDDWARAELRTRSGKILNERTKKSYFLLNGARGFLFFPSHLFP